TAPIGFSDAIPAFQVPPPNFLTTPPQTSVPPTFEGTAPIPPGNLPGESLEQVPQQFKDPTARQPPPPSEPPAPRPQGTSVARRVFAVGLVSIAALGGAGGWYLLSQRFSHTASPVVSAHTGPSATQTTINKQKGLIFTGHLA